MTWTPQMIETARHLWVELGSSADAIAAQTGRSTDAVRRLVDRLGWPKRRPGDSIKGFNLRRRAAGAVPPARPHLIFGNLAATPADGCSFLIEDPHGSLVFCNAPRRPPVNGRLSSYCLTHHAACHRAPGG